MKIVLTFKRYIKEKKSYNYIFAIYHCRIIPNQSDLEVISKDNCIVFNIIPVIIGDFCFGQCRNAEWGSALFKFHILACQILTVIIYLRLVIVGVPEVCT